MAPCHSLPSAAARAMLVDWKVGARPTMRSAVRLRKTATLALAAPWAQRRPTSWLRARSGRSAGLP